MPDRRLNDSLSALRQELERSMPRDEASLALLRRLRNDIDDILDEATDVTHRDKPDLIEQLQGAVERLEASHPSLSMALNSVINTLNNMGI